MPAELFPLACLLSGGRLGPEIAIAVLINVGGTVLCAAGLRLALKDVQGVPASVTAWPWEPEAWGLPPRKAEQAPAAGEGGEGAAAAPAEAPAEAPAAPAVPEAPPRAKGE
jgi:hypothetical protein